MRSRRIALAHAAVALLLVVIVVLLPVAVASLVADVRHPTVAQHQLTPPNDPDGVHADVHLEVVAVNEWEGTVSIRVSASQSCGRTCPWSDRYIFVSTYGDDDGSGAGRPGTETVDLPKDAPDITKVIKLPVFGDPIRYPFDHYRMGLGFEVQRITPDGVVTTLSPAEAREYVWVTLQSRVPRIVASTPDVVDMSKLSRRLEPENLVAVHSLSFGRPPYMQILTVLLVLLVTAAAIFAVVMRPLDQLVINAGALVLGVWGVRAILLGPGIPGLTLVDIALLVVVMFLLVAIALRTLWLLEEESAVKLLRRRSGTPTGD